MIFYWGQGQTNTLYYPPVGKSAEKYTYTGYDILNKLRTVAYKNIKERKWMNIKQK